MQPVAAAQDLERRRVGLQHPPAAVELHHADAVVVQEARQAGAERIGRRQRLADADELADMRQQGLQEFDLGGLPAVVADGVARAPHDAQPVPPLELHAQAVPAAEEPHPFVVPRRGLPLVFRIEVAHPGQLAMGKLPRAQHPFVERVVDAVVLAHQVRVGVAAGEVPDEVKAHVVVEVLANDEGVPVGAAGFLDQRRGGGPEGVVEGGLVQRREDAPEGVVGVHPPAPRRRVRADLRREPHCRTVMPFLMSLPGPPDRTAAFPICHPPQCRGDRTAQTSSQMGGIGKKCGSKNIAHFTIFRPPTDGHCARARRSAPDSVLRPRSCAGPGEHDSRCRGAAALRSPGGLAPGPDRGPLVEGVTILPGGARSTGSGPRSYAHRPSIGIRMARPTTTGPGPARQGNPCSLFFVTVSRGGPPRPGRAACGHDAGAGPLADTSSGDRLMRLLPIPPGAGAVAGSRRRSRWAPLPESRSAGRRAAPSPGGGAPR